MSNIADLGNWQDLGPIDIKIAEMLLALPARKQSILLDFKRRGTGQAVCIEALIADYGTPPDEDDRHGEWLEYRAGGLPGRCASSEDWDTYEDALDSFEGT